MRRLRHDRYLVLDTSHACDLVTGVRVPLESLSMCRPAEASPLPARLCEVLAHGRDGAPRALTLDAADASEAAAVMTRAGEAGRARGFVAIGVEPYHRFREVLRDQLAERTVLLIAGPDSEASAARHALLDIAVRAPRAHVLLLVRVAGQPRRSASVIREPRSAYAAIRPTAPPDELRWVVQVEGVEALARTGRHAAAERQAQEAAAALARRGAWDEASRALVILGRLQLERGDVVAADTAFGDAAGAAREDGRMIPARLWQSAARCDAGRFTEAESLARAVLVSGAPSSAHRAWGLAALARVALWQQREPDDPVPELTATERDELGPVTAAFIDATAVRVLARADALVPAGRRAREVALAAEASADPLAILVAQAALLRLRAATGDLAGAEESLRRVRAAARIAKAPLRLMRGRLLWHDALCAAGDGRAAARELALLRRVARAAPPLLRRAIDARVNRGAGAAGVEVSVRLPPPTAAPLAATFVQLAHDESDDALAVRSVIERTLREIQPGRLELLSCDAGPMSTLLSLGPGMPTRLGGRVLESGMPIGPEQTDGGLEIAVPVRLGRRLLGAIVARWPPDRHPRAGATELLALAAAALAPRLEMQLARARVSAAATTAVPELVGASAAMSEVRSAILRAAAAPFTVLVEGESGVGKELVARAIHQHSARRERRFCDINCAAIPEELLDSELFGHARGAFTGAVVDRAGLFEEADGGTLFLDEVADLSARGQAKLLRVLQQHEVRRVGEAFSRRVDVRLVAAANRDMRAESASGRFRSDLLYRLDVIRIRIPPLRERPDDIPLLAEHFWRVVAPRVGTTAVLTHAAVSELTRYSWPGNIRELQNVMAALAVAAPPRGRVPVSLLPPVITGAAVVASARLVEARTQFERRCVEIALAQAGGNRTKAAARLGLSRQGLLKTMRRLQIEAQ